MDTMESIIDAHPNVDNIQDAADFLHDACPGEYLGKKYLGMYLPERAAFASALYRNRELHDDLKKAHARRELSGFWHILNRESSYRDCLLSLSLVQALHC
jgi:hypothetical protein